MVVAQKDTVPCCDSLELESNSHHVGRPSVTTSFKLQRSCCIFFLFALLMFICLPSGAISAEHDDCPLDTLVLLVAEGGSGSRAAALLLEKSGVFQVTGKVGRCGRQASPKACIRTGTEENSACSDANLDYGSPPSHVKNLLKQRLEDTKDICSPLPQGLHDYVNKLALTDMKDRASACKGKFGLPTTCPKIVGWKDSRLLQLLPGFTNLNGIKIRVLHLVRDGRDMATSHNQALAKTFKAAKFFSGGSKYHEGSKHNHGNKRNHGKQNKKGNQNNEVYSMQTWAAVNTQFHDCAQSLKLPYKFVRIEDLVTSDIFVREKSIRAIHQFIGIDKPASNMSTLKHVFEQEIDANYEGGVQSAYGTRWKSLDQSMLDKLAEVGSKANTMFGYGYNTDSNSTMSP